ncbi:putative membrane protein [Helicobacter pylori R055a]|nr:putative membrane protein [Helicobacter pylori R055a]
MFLKSVRIFKLFYYAIFDSVLLKLLFLKMGFWLLCFVI